MTRIFKNENVLEDIRSQEFNLIPDREGFYLDVKYPHEERPRYFIDMVKQFCTCAGFMFTTHCKHMKKYKNKLHSLQLVWDETR